MAQQVRGGVLVRVDTSGAVLQQQQLRAETDKVIVSLDRQDKTIRALETRMGAFGNNIQRVFTQARSSMLYVPQGMDQLAQQTERAGQSANRAATFFQRLLGAAGATGAARGFGVTTAAARALYGSLNPLGIAVGVVSGALLQLVVSATGTELALEKARAKSAEAQAEFSRLADSRSRLQQALEQSFRPESGGSGGGFGDRFKQQADAMAEGIRNIQKARDELRRTADLQGDNNAAVEFGFGRFDPNRSALQFEQIKSLAEQLGRPDILANLERARSIKPTLDDILAERRGGPLPGQLTDESFARFEREQAERDRRLRPLRDLERLGIARDESGNFTMTAANAEKLLADAYKEQSEALARVNRQLSLRQQMEGFSQLRQFGIAQQREFDERLLGPRERAALQAARDVERKQGRPLNERQSQEADLVRDQARAMDEQEASAERAKKALEEHTKATEDNARAQAQAEDALSRKIQALESETAALRRGPTARAEQAIIDDLNELADAANEPRTPGRSYEIARIARDRVQAEQALRNQEQAERDLEQQMLRNEELERRRTENLAELQDEMRVLTATTEEQARQAKILAETNQLLRQTETDPASDIGRMLAFQVRLNAAQAEYNEQLQAVRDYGGQVFGNIGAAIGDAALRTGDFGRNLAEAFAQIGRMESSRLLGMLLSRFGSMAAGALFGQLFAPPGAAGGSFASTNVFDNPSSFQSAGSPWTPFARGGAMTHGPNEFAATGTILNQWGMVNYGKRNIGVAEGGGSTPEAIVPLQRDRFGRLGVGSSGTASTYNFYLPESMSTAAEISAARPTLIQMASQMSRMQGKYNGTARAPGR